MERLETIIPLPFPLSRLFTKETSAAPAVPRNHHISLLRFAALLLLCLLQAGEHMDAGRHSTCLGRGPATPPRLSFSCGHLLHPPSCPPPASAPRTGPALAGSHPTAPRAISHLLSPLMGDILKLGSSGRKQGEQGTELGFNTGCSITKPAKEVPSSWSHSCSSRIH